MATDGNNGPVIERAEDFLSITMRTYRSGDWVHYIFGALTTGFALLIVAIGISNGTLFDSWITLLVALGGIAYGWFAITRFANHKVLTIAGDLLTVKHTPLPAFSRSIEVPLADLGRVVARQERIWIPPLQWHQVSHLEATGMSSPLFAALDPEDANRIRAAIVAFLAAHR